MMDRGDADEALVRAARAGDGEDELAAQLHALRDELTEPASPQARRNHLDAMRRAAADPTVELPVDATAELAVEETVRTVTPLRRRHRAVVLVAAATVGVVGLTGGLAAAGRLPRAAQDRVADVVKVIGIDLPRHDDARDVGPGNGRENLRPTSTRAGASGTAPPVGPQGPGATGTLPGSSGSAPGHSLTGPGKSDDSPGHTKGTTGDTITTSPGNSGSAPGQSSDEPGDSGNAPGQSGSNGNSGNAPGSSGNAPGRNKEEGDSSGKSGSAPGQNTTSSTVAPGKSGNAPGRSKNTVGSPTVQGSDQ